MRKKQLKKIGGENIGYATFHAEYDSDFVVIRCGDYRLKFVEKFLKKVYGCREMDSLTTAGGSRTISLKLVTEDEMEKFLIKRKALFIDLEAYLSHNAKRIVIAGHSSCGFWPEFNSEEEEDRAHIESIWEAGKILKEMYPDREIILLYEIVNPRTHRALKMKEINLISGEVTEILIKNNPIFA